MACRSPKQRYAMIQPDQKNASDSAWVSIKGRVDGRCFSSKPLMASYQIPSIISKCFGHHHSGSSKARETSPISVLVDPITDRKTRPSHWLNDKGDGFRNPWPSWRDYSMHDYAGLVRGGMSSSLKSINHASTGHDLV